MSTATPPLSRTRRRLLAVLALAVIGVGAWRLVVHATAWSHFSRAREALDRDDPATARRHLARCLATWPESAETHFLAAQAARRDGDLDAANRHLDDAARLKWVPDAITVERSLIRADSGRFLAVEALLVRLVTGDHPETANIVPVLAAAYMREGRWEEAHHAAKLWTDRKPESARAWAVRGETLEHLRRKPECIEALRTSVKLDSSDRRARLRLARMLLEARESTDEAAGHLEALDEPGIGDPEVRTQLAVCREAQGKFDEAAKLLDRVIADHPPDARPLYFRGRLEMNLGKAATALPFLRKSVELDRSKLDSLYSLFQCLQQTGPPEAARAAEAQWKQADADLKRVPELSRQLTASPRDPNLRREIGELLLRNGLDADGLQWLESALREDPNHAATHAVLAAYYTRIGKPEQAARHK